MGPRQKILSPACARDFRTRMGFLAHASRRNVQKCVAWIKDLGPTPRARGRRPSPVARGSRFIGPFRVDRPESGPKTTGSLAVGRRRGGGGAGAAGPTSRTSESTPRPVEIRTGHKVGHEAVAGI